jgi:type II secretory pathway component GspD/PulD (secretin)
MSKKRTLNISHGFAEVSSLISSAFGGEVYTDENNGLVIFTGVSDSQMSELKPLILNTVEPRKMVEIRAVIVDNKVLNQIDQSKNMVLEAQNEQGIFSLDNNGFVYAGSILNFTEYSHFLELLTQELIVGIGTSGEEKITNNDSIIKPYVTTLSGESATIQIGDTWNYISESTQTSDRSFDTGYNLTITPVVNADDTITMDININVSEGADTDKEKYSLFIENKRETTTKVLVNNLDTLVIGGLEGKVTDYIESKLPFFGDIPIIGAFFRWKEEKDDSRSVTIFLTPRIIETKGKPMQVFGQNIE